MGNRSREAVLETVLGGLTLTAHGLQVMALAGAEAGGTITAADGLRPALRHLMSKNFSAPRSAPKPASVTQ